MRTSLSGHPLRPAASSPRAVHAGHADVDDHDVGRRRSVISTAVSPSGASPMTRMCGARVSESRSPSSTTSWSSTIRPVISRRLRSVDDTRPSWECGKKAGAVRLGAGGADGAAVADPVHAGECGRTRVPVSPRRRARRRRARSGARIRQQPGQSRASSEKVLPRPGRRWRRLAETPQAPASRAASTTRASWVGWSERPGRSGARPTGVHPCLDQRGQRPQPLPGRCGAGLGRAPDSVVDRRHRERHRDVRARSRLGEHVDIPDDRAARG